MNKITLKGFSKAVGLISLTFSLIFGFMYLVILSAQKFGPDAGFFVFFSPGLLFVLIFLSSIFSEE